MKKYQSNIFRQTAALIAMVLMVVCGNVAVAQTLTSSEGNSTMATTTTITLTDGDASSWYWYYLYNNGTFVNKLSWNPQTKNPLNFENVALTIGENVFTVMEGWQNDLKYQATVVATLTITRTEPPTPTGNESFTVKGSSDGVLDFDSNGGKFQNAPINCTGLNPNAKYYFFKSTDADQTNPTRTALTIAADGTANTHLDVTAGIDLYLKIDDGTGKAGQTVATMHMTQSVAPTLVVNPASSAICSGGTVYVLAKNIFEEYTLSDWVIPGDLGTPTLEDKGHTLKFTNVPAGTFIVKLKLKESTDVLLLPSTPTPSTDPSQAALTSTRSTPPFLKASRAAGQATASLAPTRRPPSSTAPTATTSGPRATATARLRRSGASSTTTPG